MTLRTKYDVAIVGGGPVGCVTALAFARRGASVVVLEADPRAAHRFAGEWIHPAGVAVLDRLRAGRLDGASPRTGYGFVIVPDDGKGPVQMPYPNGVALAAEHSDIVAALRRAAIGAGVEIVENVRVVGIDGHVVRGEDRLKGRPLDLEADRIVGADGRSSLVRQSLGLPDHSQVLSYMACVELRDVPITFEGFGQVILGGPGPMLIYRIGENVIRGCLDVPLSEGPRSRTATYLWDAFARLMPAGTQDAFRDSLARAPLVWAANRFRPRSHFGRGHVALVGDAIGHTHPLTALGMTNGFLDAEALVESSSITEYEARRRAHVPEVLTGALYQCFQREDAGATSLRAAMMDVLRTDAAERERTLKIMSGEDGSKRSFGGAFMRMAAHAASRVVKDAPRRRAVPERLLSFATWMQWPMAGLMPQRLVPRDLRARASMRSPLPMLDEMTEAFRAPQRAGDRKVPDVDPTAAIQRASDALLADLEALAQRFGTDADHVLAMPALRRLRAIDASGPSAAMSARLTIARRRLAREGVPRLLGLVAGAERDHWTAEEVAELLLFVLGGPTSETVVGLLEAVRALLSCADGNGFGARPGAPATLRSTERVVRALELALRARGAELPADVKERIARARERATTSVRLAEVREGHFRTREGGPDETASAIHILSGCGIAATDPMLRRAVHALSRDLSAANASGDPSAVAHALSAILGSGVPAPEATLTAARALVDGVEAGRIDGEPLAFALEALGALAAVRSARPVVTPTRRGKDGVPAHGMLVQGLPARGASSHGSPGKAAAPNADAATSSDRVVAATVEKRPAAAAPVSVRVVSGERGEADWAYCKQALAEVSRTFARPIALLPGELEVAVTLGYLLCRVADTVEDHLAVPGERRDELFGLFLGVLERGEDPQAFAAAFRTIEGEDAELDLARQLPRVMAVYNAQREPMQDATVRWVSEMARGMSLYSHRRAGKDGLIALETVQDLERYCYYVAGTVGHFLTDVFLVALGPKASPELGLMLRKDAEDFAAGLQLVNILKDVTDDRARGWSFVPRTACADSGIGVPELTDDARRAQAHEAVAPLFDIARGKLEGALRYALAVPSGRGGDPALLLAAAVDGGADVGDRPRQRRDVRSRRAGEDQPRGGRVDRGRVREARG